MCELWSFASSPASRRPSEIVQNRFLGVQNLGFLVWVPREIMCHVQYADSRQDPRTRDTTEIADFGVCCWSQSVHVAMTRRAGANE